MGTYNQEFKDEVVALYRSGGRTYMDLAKEFNLSATTVANWARAEEKHKSRKRRPSSGGDDQDVETDQEKIARLERELARKSEDLDILGKALAFFVRRMDR
jgi:transposase